MRLLVVEDDRGIGKALSEGLRREGFDVTWVENGLDALSGLDHDLVLLDVRLPGIDGFEVCRRIRSTGNEVPIIFMTARGEEVDKVVGLELGGDDYVVKPFGLREMVARIKAVNRRTGPAPSDNQTAKILHLGPLTVDRRRRRVLVDDEEVALTPKEFELLSVLAEDPGAVVTRQELLERVWDPHWYGPSKTVDVHVASLRRKLDHADWVETVRGVGLRIGDSLVTQARLFPEGSPKPGTSHSRE